MITTCLHLSHVAYGRCFVDVVISLLLVGVVLRNIEMAAMVLGHGFKRQLSAAVYVPPATNGEKSFLHIWVLLKELDMYRWHKLVAFRSLD